MICKENAKAKNLFEVLLTCGKIYGLANQTIYHL